MKEIDPIDLNLKTYYNQCVSYSRPCQLTNVVKAWPAFEKWSYATDGYKYLEKLFGDTDVTVYIDEDATSSDEDFSSFTFKPETSVIKPFAPEFLTSMSQKALGMSLRETSKSII